MFFNFQQDWPVLVLIGLFAAFLVAMYQNGKKNSQKEKENAKNNRQAGK